MNILIYSCCFNRPFSALEEMSTQICAISKQRAVKWLYRNILIINDNDNCKETIKHVQFSIILYRLIRRQKLFIRFESWRQLNLHLNVLRYHRQHISPFLNPLLLNHHLSPLFPPRVWLETSVQAAAQAHDLHNCSGQHFKRSLTAGTRCLVSKVGIFARCWGPRWSPTDEKWWGGKGCFHNSISENLCGLECLTLWERRKFAPS